MNFQTVPVSALFTNLYGQGFLLPLKDGDFLNYNFPAENQHLLQQYLDENYDTQSTNWAVSGYLENRSQFFTRLGCQQMVEQQRFYHLGLDICVPIHTVLHAPIDGEVIMAEYEVGNGNYGGMVVLKHTNVPTPFYSLYGHLNKTDLPQVGSRIFAGEKISTIGGFDTNGGYFIHVHVQCITQKGFRNDWVHKGYCTAEQVPTIHEYCPDPSFLFTSSV